MQKIVQKSALAYRPLYKEQYSLNTSPFFFKITMPNIADAAHLIEHNAVAAEHGDSTALDLLKTELRALSPEDLKQVANQMQADMGKSSSRLLSGADITRDESGNVMSIEFSPSMSDRVSSKWDGAEAHSVNITVTVVDNVNAPPEMAAKSAKSI